MNVWVLTREHNDYDQHGEYFVAIFRCKPTRNAIGNVLNIDHKRGEKLIDHILAGGGRRDIEDEWYHLREVEFSE